MGIGDAVVIGLGSMIGAGVFGVLGCSGRPLAQRGLGCWWAW